MSDASTTWQTEYSLETDATPETIWRIFRDVPGWKAWNAGIEQIAIDGPFADGTWFTMKPPGQDAFRSKLVDVRENEHFVDETRVEGLVVRVAHRIERLDGGRARITYAIETTGPGAVDVGAAIASDFPEVLAALVKLAEGR